MKIVKDNFPALQERNYQLHFWGQLISMTGFWLQLQVQGWMIQKITHSPEKVSDITALTIGMSAVAGLLGGVIADRFDRRKVLYITQALLALMYFILSAVAWSNCVRIESIFMALNFFIGSVLGVYVIARNTFVNDIVSPENLKSGMTLNSAMVNVSRIIGPGIAGSLIVYVGEGCAILVGGLLTLVVMITLPLMKFHPAERNEKATFWEGVVYTFTNPALRFCMVLVGLIGVFGFSYMAIIPTITEEVYKGGPKTMSYLAAAAGLGAFIGSCLASRYSKSSRSLRIVAKGCIVSGIALIFFSMVSTLVFGATLLLLVGAGYTVSFASVLAESQAISKTDMRGRVMGITMTLFLGGISTGGWLAGCIAQKFSCPVSMAVFGILAIAIAIAVYLLEKKFNAELVK